MYTIKMYVKRTMTLTAMPGMEHLGLEDAKLYCTLYINRNPDCNFLIINEDNGEILHIYM